jgi:negative regulator of sigma-B (phosphoserine phosphatase)
VPDAEAAGAELVELGIALRGLEGEAESGDTHIAKRFDGGLLLAAIDGLGHGQEAAAAAGIARSTLDEHASETPESIFQRCHERLRRTRGVVMSLASFREAAGSMTWVGVGNVEGKFLRWDGQGGWAGDSILLHGGVVGYQMPHLRPATFPVSAGDVLVFATDGVHSHFGDGLEVRGPVQEIADRILDTHSREDDDALVLVARYREGWS